MRAFVNLIAIVAIVAAAYGIGLLNKKFRFSEEATLDKQEARNLAWVEKDWYRGSDGKEWRTEGGRIARANGCKNEMGVITRSWMKGDPEEKKDPEEENN